MAFAPHANAQTSEVRGVVRDSASGKPVSAAVVLALDALGTTINRTITGERGQYRLQRPASAMLVRAVRLGFRPTTERLPLVLADLMTVDLTLAPVPRALDAMEVTAARGCPTRGDRADAYALLDQARAGLLATVVARERQPAELHVLRFERYLDLDGVDVLRQVVRVDSSRNVTTSFNAVHSAIDFVDRGFRAGAAGEYTYFGPDADVLLDERFQRGYCFSLAAADSARSSQVGLRFSAANHRDGRVDIDGTLWIDTAARALHDIEFRYVGIEALAESFNAGGRVGFRTLPSGVPFIDQWMLRLVGAPDTIVAALGQSSQVYAIREIGGELARAQWPDGQTWDGELSTLHITAVNRRGEVSAGAILTLARTGYRVTTDSNGRGTIAHVLPGPYEFVVDDPRLKEINVQIPTGRTITARRASAALVRVIVPSAQEYMASVCGREIPALNEAWLLARVVAGDGQPVAGAKWRVSTADGSRWRVVADNGIAGADGLLHVCRGLPNNSSIEVAAWRDPKDAVRVKHAVSEGFAVVRVPLPTLAARAIGEGMAIASELTVVVSGTVKDSLTGRVVPDARVTFLGTPFEGATDASGTFIISGVARGVHMVEVSTPWLDSIGIASRTSATLSATSTSLSLFVPSITAIMFSACGSQNMTGFLVGRVRVRNDRVLPVGVRVVAASENHAPIVSAVAPNGAFRLCGVPTGVRVLVRAESDSGKAWVSAPLSVRLLPDRPFARVDPVLVDTTGHDFETAVYSTIPHRGVLHAPLTPLVSRVAFRMRDNVDVVLRSSLRTSSNPDNRRRRRRLHDRVHHEFCRRLTHGVRTGRGVSRVTVGL